MVSPCATPPSPSRATVLAPWAPVAARVGLRPVHRPSRMSAPLPYSPVAADEHTSTLRPFSLPGRAHQRRARFRSSWCGDRGWGAVDVGDQWRPEARGCGIRQIKEWRERDIRVRKGCGIGKTVDWDKNRSLLEEGVTVLSLLYMGSRLIESCRAGMPCQGSGPGTALLLGRASTGKAAIGSCRSWAGPWATPMGLGPYGHQYFSLNPSQKTVKYGTHSSFPSPYSFQMSYLSILTRGGDSPSHPHIALPSC